MACFHACMGMMDPPFADIARPGLHMNPLHFQKRPRSFHTPSASTAYVERGVITASNRPASSYDTQHKYHAYNIRSNLQQTRRIVDFTLYSENEILF